MKNQPIARISIIAVFAFGAGVVPASAGSLDGLVDDPVVAALPQSTGPDWSGPYVGLTGSFASHDVDHDYDDALVFGYTADGASGGIVVGYDGQSGNFVYGLEASRTFGGETGSGLCDSSTSPSCSGSGSEPTITFDQITTVKVRLGLTNGDFMYYGTVGLAKAAVTVSDIRQPATVDRTHDGRTVGLGAEWMAMERLSIGLEYEFMRFDEIPYPLVSTPDTIDFQSSRISASVKYHF